MDIILSLRRVGAESTPVRKIETESRFDETPPRLYLRLASGGYESLGTSLAAAVLSALPSAASEAIPIEAVMDATSLSRSHVQRR